MRDTKKKFLWQNEIYLSMSKFLTRRLQSVTATIPLRVINSHSFKTQTHMAFFVMNLNFMQAISFFFCCFET